MGSTSIDGGGPTGRFSGKENRIGRFQQQGAAPRVVGGPAFVLQLAGREVIVDDNGTPEDGTDDTYTVVSNSGALLPDCGDAGFTGWDYALAVDGINGVMYAHEYILYGVQIGAASDASLCHFGDARGRVSCDPTPDNPNDPGPPIYALRNLVAESPVGDGDEVIEGGPAQSVTCAAASITRT